MKVLWAVARYEFKMQRRYLAFWLTAIVLLAFLFGEVLPGILSDAVFATSSEPVEYSTQSGETINLTADVQEALSVVNFSKYEAWLFADRIGLMSALFISVLSAFVWGRDRESEMSDIVNSRPVTSQQYVLGKYLGVVLTWGVITLLTTAIGIGRTWQVAHKFDLSFVWLDFISPVISWMGVSLLYGTAFVMMTSILLRSGVGAMLVHFLYWIYNVTQLRMFSASSKGNFLTYWFFRFSERDPVLLQNRIDDILLNRIFYLAMTAVVLTFVSFVFHQLRERGTLLSTVIQAEDKSSNWLQILWRKIRLS